MAVKLRLTRMGRKKKPFYRIIAIDSRAPRNGRYLENVGYYNPLKNPSEVSIKEDRALYWLNVGAIPSDTVRSLFRREGILFKWDLIKRGISEEKMEEEMKRWEVIQIERKRKLEKKQEEKKKIKAQESKEEPAEGEGEEVAAEVEEAQNQQTETKEDTPKDEDVDKSE